MFTPRPPPPPQKVLQNYFQIILSDMSLDAPGRLWTPLDGPVRPGPVRPCTPLCQNMICLKSPAQERVT